MCRSHEYYMPSNSFLHTHFFPLVMSCLWFQRTVLFLFINLVFGISICLFFLITRTYCQRKMEKSIGKMFSLDQEIQACPSYLYISCLLVPFLSCQLKRNCFNFISTTFSSLFNILGVFSFTFTQILIFTNSTWHAAKLIPYLHSIPAYPSHINWVT
jgi:hypothetical protein